MTLPKTPVYCEICKSDSITMWYKRNDDGTINNTMLESFVVKIPEEDIERRFTPIQGTCEFCGQIKLFTPDNTVRK